MKKKLLLTSLLAAGAGIFAAGDYFFKIAMTPYKKEPDSKKLSGKDSLYPDKVCFRDFPKKNGVLRLKTA
ncbi:hypothetical protein [uncultured Lactobacillus sp.]|uniref:hypothetical protein n=1 Tax=uncultured Lactobacillus sp. TaxID=153152 RepID=UPI00258BCCF7|nr:hypothetical protein [uncultured Lactobacillus sp.]